MLSLSIILATVAAIAQPALGLPTEQLEARGSVCSLNENTWTATMTGGCSIDGGSAIACDMRTDLKNLIVQKNTMLSAKGLGNNQFECVGYQQVSTCTNAALHSRHWLTWPPSGNVALRIYPSTQPEHKLGGRRIVTSSYRSMGINPFLWKIWLQ
ncbi:hypothetical protein CGCVW01_v014360 [Colletotrichum viniferum]|nr:hypothetical protein CGCVW01_v014360 [Colletotrichum viniferum]